MRWRTVASESARIGYRSRSTTLKCELLICMPPLYLMEPSPSIPVHKEAHAASRDPNHFCQGSWEILATIFSGCSSLPYLATSRTVRAERLSLELKSWSIKSSSKRKSKTVEMLRKCG